MLPLYLHSLTPSHEEKEKDKNTDQTEDLNDAFMCFAIASPWQRTDEGF